ncbi:CRISPR-associated helicase Cas3' [Desulfocurvus sp. DL9XJH121]
MPEAEHTLLFRCWGKARTNNPRAEVIAHPLPCHALDVASVAVTLLRSDPALAERITALSPLTVAQTISLLTFFAAIHDLGKLSLPFQWQVPELAKAAGLPTWTLATSGAQYRHTILARGIWKPLRADIARSLGAEDDRFLRPLEEAAFGHHGEPSTVNRTLVPGFNNGLTGAARALADGLAELFLHGHAPGFVPVRIVPELAETLDEESLRPLSWLAAGLFVLADWIGSNGTWFPPCPAARDLTTYWPQALKRADTALSQAGVLPVAPSAFTDFHCLLPHLDAALGPRPMQAAVLDLPEPGGPELLILEDVTGGGKTEAAVLAAHRFMRSGQACGIFVGLPTMATANAMYSRLSESYRALFADPEASLVLAHGARALNDGYLKSIALETTPALARGTEDAEAFCSAWIADNRKKALLAPCGAGTLDQALLAILPSRHQSLRLLGLARSVLVADEVHAYDAYTGRLLEILLTFHAALGGSAVLLTATMPLALRERLVAAWGEGRALLAPTGACPPLESPVDEGFPLLTRVTDAELCESRVAAAHALDVAVELVHDEERMFQALVDAHRAGACACWVRNTVADAMDARQRLVQDWGLPEIHVHLFHARYAGCDRKRIESQVLERFGKSSTARERAGHIVVGTQVLEQSLDYDVDLMLSDLAPMELLIQRAGRCHRHLRGAAQQERPQGYRTARIIVLGPEPTPDAGPKWFAEMFDAGQWVYPSHGMLWLTASLLRDKGRLRLPEDARELVEGAYGGGAPKALDELDAKVLGESYAKFAQAEFSALSFSDGYCIGSGMQWDRDMKTPTRLGQATQQVRLVRCQGGEAALWAARDACDVSMRACLESELRVPVYRLSTPLVPTPWGDRLEALRQTMPDQGRWSLLLPLFQEGEGTWIGHGRDEKGREVTVEYGAMGLNID